VDALLLDFLVDPIFLLPGKPFKINNTYPLLGFGFSTEFGVALILWTSANVSHFLKVKRFLTVYRMQARGVAPGDSIRLEVSAGAFDGGVHSGAASGTFDFEGQRDQIPPK
jgi:hypothetical protein